MKRLSVVLAVLAMSLVAAPAAAARSWSGDGTEIQPGSSGVSSASSPSACSDNQYDFIGPNSAWSSTLEWRFRASSTPAGLDSADVLSTIKRSFRNVVNANNNCGRADHVSATHRYLGTTNARPGVSRSGGCTGTDGRSVVAFAPLNDYYAGYTCIWWNGSNHIFEMDMRLDPDQAWALSLSGCSNELMMEALVTHEVGHAFGLAHVNENNHGRLTMSVYIDDLCENQESTLGLGDMLGLEVLY